MAFNKGGPLAVVSGMAFEARIAAGDGIRNFYGLDTQKLVQEIVQASEKGLCGILSFGVAAGLDPSLTPGSIVIASDIRTKQETFKADEDWSTYLLQQLPGAKRGDIAGVDSPIESAKDKAALYSQTQAVVADMESHHAARIAEQHAIPFAAIRIVLDDADCTLPYAALAATSQNGTINYVGVITALARNPTQLPAMIALGKKNRLAMAALLRCSDLVKHRRFGLMDLG